MKYPFSAFIPFALAGALLVPTLTIAAESAKDAPKKPAAGQTQEIGPCGVPAKPRPKRTHAKHHKSVTPKRPVCETPRSPEVLASLLTSALPALNFSPAVLPAVAPKPEVDTTPAFDPRISNPPLSGQLVTEVTLRPLFVTTVRLPEPVTSIAVGAPTMIAAEHSDDDPRLVFLKPTTHEPVESNAVIALQSGDMVVLKLTSPGDNGTASKLDYVLDYRTPRSLLSMSGEDESPALSAGPSRQEKVRATQSTAVNPVDQALQKQAAIAAPMWLTASDLKGVIKANVNAPTTIAASVGSVVQNGETMTVTYSVLNVSDQWVQVLPPQVQLANPAHKTPTKKRAALAEQIPVQDFRLSVTKLPPGARADCVVQFARPGFKQSKEAMLLQIATAAAVDTPLLMPVPFVAPGN
jgi:hypothetical protein